jgi:predicted PurR-regulated permease PerM
MPTGTPSKSKEWHKGWLRARTPESDPVLFHVVKATAIGYTTTLFFIVGLAIALVLERVLPAFDERIYARRSTVRIVIEVLLHVFLIGVLVYVVRRLMSQLPSPFENMVGFRQELLSEKSGGVFLVTAMTLLIDGAWSRKVHYLLRARLMPALPLASAVAVQ